MLSAGNDNAPFPLPQIVTIYKNRWIIGLLFKQIKQISVALLLGRKPQCHQNADLLRVDRPVAYDGYQKESCYQKELCQYDHRYPAAFNQLCGADGF